MISQPPSLQAPNSGGTFSKPWLDWLSAVYAVLAGLQGSGSTANRPTVALWVGRPYFDTTLNKPIWWKGAVWVDATGATV